MNPLPSSRWVLAAALCACHASASAQQADAHLQAQAAPDPNLVSYSQLAQGWVQGAAAQLQNQPGAAPGMRLEVSIGALDSRLRLAPCKQVEPYLPVGTRLWGKSRVGLRCLDGAVKWNVFLPVTVKALGKAWVLTSNVAAGSVLRPVDGVQAEVDLAEESSPVVADASAWVGSTAARQLVSGQAIRQSSIRATNAFTAGSPVKVVAQGNGFRISTEGEALSAGSLGQSVRVKMEGGRVVSGVVIDARTVLVEL